MIEYTVKVDESGTKRWFLNGKLHREDGPAVEGLKGYKAWFLNGKRHREDGPAVEWGDGEIEWYLNGKVHRVNGPAIEYSYEGKEWFLNGKKLTKKQHKKATRGSTGFWTRLCKDFYTLSIVNWLLSLVVMLSVSIFLFIWS